jgi:hypothetical protein
VGCRKHGRRQLLCKDKRNRGRRVFRALSLRRAADPASGDNLGNWTLNETSVNIQASLIALAGYFAGGDDAAGIEPPEPAAASLTALASPNPFARLTTLSFSLSAGSEVLLTIHDVEGRLVRTLVSGRRSAGPSQAVWDGCDDNGRRVAPGVYVARLESSAGAASRKLVLVR